VRPIRSKSWLGSSSRRSGVLSARHRGAQTGAWEVARPYGGCLWIGVELDLPLFGGRYGRLRVVRLRAGSGPAALPPAVSWWLLASAVGDAEEHSDDECDCAGGHGGPCSGVFRVQLFLAWGLRWSSVAALVSVKGVGQGDKSGGRRRRSVWVGVDCGRSSMISTSLWLTANRRISAARACAATPCPCGQVES
jgi:hypothetical protein